MSPEIARFNFEKELPRARERAKSLNWGWKENLETLSLRVEYQALDNELFILLAQFDDYKEKPPYLEFEEPLTGLKGTPRAYPKGHDSFFNTTGPCICAPFSRKAYEQIHGGWRTSDWMSSKENNTRWAQYSTIAAILENIYNRLITPAYYVGRMG